MNDVRRGMWALTWRRFRRSKLAVIALVYVGFVGVLAIAAPMIAGSRSTLIPFAPNDPDVANRLLTVRGVHYGQLIPATSGKRLS